MATPRTPTALFEGDIVQAAMQADLLVKDAGGRLKLDGLSLVGYRGRNGRRVPLYRATFAHPT